MLKIIQFTFHFMTSLTEPSYWRWYCLDGIRTGVGFFRV